VKKNNLEYLFTPQKQSPVAILLILYKFLTQMLRNAFPILLIFFFNPNKSFDGFELLIFILISVFSTVFSIAAYYKFEYHINNDEIIIQKGILKKVNINVPFDRIQAINTNQTFLHRIFKVASLEIDTAGSKNNEIKIDAIRIEKAEIIKNYILKQKEQIVSEETEKISAVKEEDKVILQLDIASLLKVGMGQNHLRSFAVIALFFIGLIQYADIFFEGQKLSDLESLISNTLQSFIFQLVPAAIIATLALTLGRTILKYYNLIFKQTAQGYKLVSGLFTRNEKQAAMHKIQLVGWHTNPLKNLFSMFELNLSQAFSTNMVRSQTMQIPGVYKDQLESVCDSYFPSENRADMLTHPVSPRLMIRTFFALAIIPFIMTIVKLTIPDNPIEIWMIIATVLMISIYTYTYWKKWNFKIGSEGLLVRRGFIKTSYLLLRWNKIQGIRIRQSIFQKRRSLSDLHLFTAAGVIRIPYLQEELSSQLKDYILYYVENDDGPWI